MFKKSRKSFKQRIKPPQPTQIQHQESNPEVIRLLQNGADALYNLKASELSYENLFRNCYNLVTNYEGEILHQAIIEVIDTRIKKIARKINGQPDDTYIYFLTEEWDSFSQATRLVKDVFINLEKSRKDQNLPTTADEAVERFYNNVIHGYKRTLVSDKIVTLLFADRVGETIDRMRLLKTVNMTKDIGGQCYAEIIEEPILASTRDFFQSLSVSLLQETNIPDYLRKVEERLQQEEQRTKMYLSESTVPKIRDVVIEKMVEDESSRLLSSEHYGGKMMIAYNMKDDLKRLYHLFRKIKEPLLSVFEQVLQEQAHTIVQQTPGDQITPVQFIQDIMDFNNAKSDIIQNAFRQDKDFQDILHNIKRQYFDGTENERIPECLSLFIQDKVCRSDRSSDEESKQYFEASLRLLEFLKDKDMFEEYYKHHLAIRLLHGKPDEETEKSLVSHLKAAYGGQFTKKVEQMFNDLHTSADIIAEYKKSSGYKELKASKTMPFDFSANILTTGSWPSYGDHQMRFPSEMESVVKSFEQFYHKKFNSRVLKWQALLGNGVIHALYPSRQYEVHISTIGMGILLSFNRSKQFTVQELQEALNAPVENIKHHLDALTTDKTKLLTKESQPGSDVYRINPRFKRGNVRIRVKIKRTKEESKEEQNATKDRVNLERQYVVDSYIVKVMKARKQIEHNQLIAEVTKMLQIRFTPDVSLLKKRINNLIDREYIERDSAKPRIYKYIS